jgi:hypothetical protein
VKFVPNWPAVARVPWTLETAALVAALGIPIPDEGRPTRFSAEVYRAEWHLHTDGRPCLMFAQFDVPNTQTIGPSPGEWAQGLEVQAMGDIAWQLLASRAADETVRSAFLRWLMMWGWLPPFRVVSLPPRDNSNCEA